MTITFRIQLYSHSVLIIRGFIPWLLSVPGRDLDFFHITINAQSEILEMIKCTIVHVTPSAQVSVQDSFRWIFISVCRNPERHNLRY